MSPGLPRLFAHRGCSVRAPENTMAAFRLAVEEGIEAVELDVHLSADGEPVVIHDSSLRRTTGLDAVVERTSSSTIRELDAGSWFDPRFRGERIPLLRELFDSLGDALYYDVEIKWTPHRIGPLEEAVLRLVDRSALAGRCLVSSFNPWSVRRIARGSPKLETALIFSGSRSMPPPLRGGQGRLISRCRTLKPHHALVTERFMAKFRHRLGYRVIPWTVDEPAEASRLIALGVDGLISNDPAALRAALG